MALLHSTHHIKAKLTSLRSKGPPSFIDGGASQDLMIIISCDFEVIKVAKYAILWLV